MSREFSCLTKLDPCELIAISEHVQYIKETIYSLSSIQILLEEFNVDDECGGELPEKIKSGFVRGGLLQAINCLSREAASSAEWIERQIEIAKKNNADDQT